MAGIVYIRDMNEDIVDELKQQAAEARMSLSAYAGKLLTESVALRRKGSSGMAAKLRQRAAGRRARGAVTPSREDILDVVHSQREGLDHE
ncbi:hypothetical protein OHA25_31490 [Nonomuraea sp. NBC_00507]|uniref:hypothetical protein n=1 Tax=Nonomuraea sp. NBC_00507 TaxID=2976002 RepID=UPI002E196F05